MIDDFDGGLAESVSSKVIKPPSMSLVLPSTSLTESTRSSSTSTFDSCPSFHRPFKRRKVTQRVPANQLNQSSSGGSSLQTVNESVQRGLEDLAQNGGLDLYCSMMSILRSDQLQAKQSTHSNVIPNHEPGGQCTEHTEHFSSPIVGSLVPGMNNTKDKALVIDTPPAIMYDQLTWNSDSNQIGPSTSQHIPTSGNHHIPTIASLPNAIYTVPTAMTALSTPSGLVLAPSLPQMTSLIPMTVPVVDLRMNPNGHSPPSMGNVQIVRTYRHPLNTTNYKPTVVAGTNNTLRCLPTTPPWPICLSEGNQQGNSSSVSTLQLLHISGHTTSFDDNVVDVSNVQGPSSSLTEKTQ